MKNYFTRRGWKDLIFLWVVVSLGIWVERHFYGLGLSDAEKWSRRAQVDPRHTVGAPTAPGVSGLSPCFFVVPSAEVNQPVQSATVADCLLLTPDGKKLNLFEVAVLGSEFMHIRTDLYVPGVVPIALTRATSPSRAWSKSHKAYLRHVYDLYLSGDRFPYTYLDWLLPDGQSIHFTRISQGTGYADAVYEATSRDPTFAGARINWNGFGWDVALANGATYLSPEAYNATRPQQGSLVGIFDVGENELILSRAANGDLREIKSPGGGWIRLAYDKNGRVIRADSSTAEFVEYGYDLDDNLTQVKYSNGEITEYTYDSSNRIAGVRDAAKSVSLQATYANVGTDGAVNINTVGRFGFSRTVDEKARSVDVEISDPQRQKIRVRIQVINDSLQYTVKGPRGPRVHN